MANAVLGLGQGQAGALNSDLIEKLRAADRKSSVEPLEKKLETFSKEKEVISNIGTKVDDLLKSLEIFSLNQSSGVNSFNQKSANVSGDGVVFDSDDLSALKTGSLRVEVKELAQKDVWQSKQFIDANGDAISKDSKVDKGILDIKLGGGTSIPIDTTGKTYSELVTEINKIDGVQASLVEDSAGNFKLSIKSTETGTANKITIGEGASTPFGFTNVLTAQDMELTADGVNYSSSSNTVTIDGLKITATKKSGDSTINIENDTTTLSAQMKNFADKFNELRATIENEIYSADASVDNKDALRNMLETVKSVLFGSGNSGDNSIFGYGFTFDEN